MVHGVDDVALDGLALGIHDPKSWTWFNIFDLGPSSIIFFLYWLLLEGTYDQSVGKMVMKIRVTRSDGRPVNLSNAAVQSVGKAFLLPIDCIIGWILYPTKSQRLFNYISDTIVVKSAR